VYNSREDKLMFLSDADYIYSCESKSEPCRIVSVYILVNVYVFAGSTTTGWFCRPECPEVSIYH
jgi:hypothetical protein